MNVIKTPLEGVVIIEPNVFGDTRGYFFESFSEQRFREEVADVKFVQENESKSSFGVLRGLHYQIGEFAQAKLVRVVYGKVLDVAVDMRKSSPTFGQYTSIELSGENKRQFYIPRGFAHGFLVLSPEAIFQYKCDNYYAPGKEGSVIFNDPTIGIDWGLDEKKFILSEKDTKAPLLKDAILFE